VERFSMGHDAWTTALIEQNQRWLIAYFIAATGNHAEAEDLVQETFTHALKNADSFDPSKSFGAWLRGIARNVYLEHRRKSERRLVALDEAALDQLDVAVAASEEMHTISGYGETRLEALRGCLHALSGRTEEVIRRRYAHDQPSKLIATALGMSAAAVDLVLSRARKALVDCVNKKLRSLANA
jgi:RNA polymerase sigma-70 factor, ECF subfamily